MNSDDTKRTLPYITIYQPQRREGCVHICALQNWKHRISGFCMTERMNASCVSAFMCMLSSRDRTTRYRMTATGLTLKMRKKSKNENTATGIVPASLNGKKHVAINVTHIPVQLWQVVLVMCHTLCSFHFMLLGLISFLLQKHSGVVSYTVF